MPASQKRRKQFKDQLKLHETPTLIRLIAFAYVPTYSNCGVKIYSVSLGINSNCHNNMYPQFMPSISLQVRTWFEASLVPIYTQNIDIWIPFSPLNKFCFLQNKSGFETVALITNSNINYMKFFPLQNFARNRYQHISVCYSYTVDSITII